MNLYDEAIFELEENVRINGNCIGYYAIKKALERAKKEHELLGLYRECNKESVFWLEIQQRIAQLEKELEELK